MIRQIVKIDEEKCDGCGICIDVCHEGAIALIDGKARLIRDDYCDGLGDCLPECPQGAMGFEVREALAYDEEAVKKNMEKRGLVSLGPAPKSQPDEGLSSLRNWPIQLKLSPVKASYFQGARLLIAADCSAFAHGDFHREFMEGYVTLIGCPKLDEGDYSEKISAILSQNDIKEVHLVRMEVPCCGGIERSLYRAMETSGRIIPWHITTLTSRGQIKK